MEAQHPLDERTLGTLGKAAAGGVSGEDGRWWRPVKEARWTCRWRTCVWRRAPRPIKLEVRTEWPC